MSIKSFFLKQVMKIKGVPPEQIEMITTMMEKDPELFKRIAAEIEQKKKEGKDEMLASMEVMRKYQHDIRNLLQ
ncbi:MAG: hypothetical protein US50_C0005G0025 [Candidatus Nomurabacteria bacterium GW2011_GWB1_37_5]|uniref:Uncharacterized protein n=1 Tax=Candidatus Nomurabacteria bacterium GW2011_GWB1_37_5 TaxID=1618742 RepID=A0A0G0JG73_9BACT|nr:MAG: hypothetical protein US50_C0005G0025 [Candidatus Nomurabacteria bacterium GW2011_GWB1_37_5]